MKWFSRSKQEEVLPVVQTAAKSILHPYSELYHTGYVSRQEYRLYRTLREAVPIIDAAIGKIVRLIGTFEIRCERKSTEKKLNDFLRNVRTDSGGRGIGQFLYVYLGSLITYGTAVAEIVPSGDGRRIYSLMNVPLSLVELKKDKNGIDIAVYPTGAGETSPLPYQELLCVSALEPEPGSVYGTSVLRGLPFVSSILLGIYNTTGVNFERVGNVRFAVTYKPSTEGDRAMSRQRAAAIADEWSKAMRNRDTVSDFVSVGDVSVSVIGADNQVLDTEIPVRQMLEQIVAKLSIPPFLLGLSWSTTERMSSQQADILTSELEYYRNILNGVIQKICDLWLTLEGIDCDYTIEWENISLQDETELAQARLANAQAALLEKELEEYKNEQKQECADRQ